MGKGAFRGGAWRADAFKAGAFTGLGQAPTPPVGVPGPYYFFAAAMYTPGSSSGLVYVAGASLGQLTVE